MTWKITVTIVLGFIVQFISTANIRVVNLKNDSADAKLLLKKITNLVKNSETSGNNAYVENDVSIKKPNHMEFDNCDDGGNCDGRKPFKEFHDSARSSVEQVKENEKRINKTLEDPSKGLRNGGYRTPLSTDYIDPEELRLRTKERLISPFKRIYINDNLFKKLVKNMKNNHKIRKGVIRKAKASKGNVDSLSKAKTRDSGKIANRQARPESKKSDLSTDYLDPGELYGSGGRRSSNLENSVIYFDVQFNSQKANQHRSTDNNLKQNDKLIHFQGNLKFKPYDDDDEVNSANESVADEEMVTKDAEVIDEMDMRDSISQEFFHGPKSRFEILKSIPKGRHINDVISYEKNRAIVQISEERNSARDSLEDFFRDESEKELEDNVKQQSTEEEPEEIYIQGYGHHINPNSIFKSRKRHGTVRRKQSELRRRESNRLPYFLPKRSHWSDETIKNLSPVWIEEINFK